MAAGKGSRYGSLKQFDGLGPQGEFLLEYSILDAIQAGFRQIVVVTQTTQVDFLEVYLKKRLPSHIQLIIIAQKLTDLPQGVTAPNERQKPWGTAHAVWTARDIIKEGFVVLNADDFYGKEAFKKAAKFFQTPTTPRDFGLVSYPLHQTLSEHGAVSRGICRIQDQFLVGIEERTKITKEGNKILDLDSGIIYTGKEQISMNFWICQPSFFESIGEQLKIFVPDSEHIHTKELYIPTVIAHLMEHQKIKVQCIPSDSEWFGVTYAEDKTTTVLKLQQMAKNQVYPSPLWKTTKSV